MAHTKEKKIQFLWFGNKSPKSSHSCCSTWGNIESCVNKNYTKSHWKGWTETSLCTSVCFAATWRVALHAAALLSRVLTPCRNVSRLCLCHLLCQPKCFKNMSLYDCSWHSSHLRNHPYLHNFGKLQPLHTRSAKGACWSLKWHCGKKEIYNIPLYGVESQVHPGVSFQSKFCSGK